MKRIITILLVAILTGISAGYAQMRTKPLSEMTKSEKKAYLKWLESEIEEKQKMIAWYESKKQLSEEEQKKLAAYRQATYELSSITEEVEDAISDDEWWEEHYELIVQVLMKSALQRDISKMPSLAQMRDDAVHLPTIDFLIKYDPCYMTLSPVNFQNLSLEEKKLRYKLQERAVFKAQKEIYKYEKKQTEILENLQDQIYQKIEFYPQLDASTLVPNSQYADVVEQVNTQLEKAGYEPLNKEEKAYIVNSTKEAEAAYDKIEADKWKMQKEEKKLKDVWDIIKVECPECAQQKK